MIVVGTARGFGGFAGLGAVDSRAVTLLQTAPEEHARVCAEIKRAWDGATSRCPGPKKTRYGENPAWRECVSRTSGLFRPKWNEACCDAACKREHAGSAPAASRRSGGGPGLWTQFKSALKEQGTGARRAGIETFREAYKLYVPPESPPPDLPPDEEYAGQGVAGDEPPPEESSGDEAAGGTPVWFLVLGGGALVAALLLARGKGAAA